MTDDRPDERSDDRPYGASGDGGADERTVRVSWGDPLAGLASARARGLSGVEYLRAIQRGELPAAPIASILGFTLAEVEEGRVVFTVEPGERHYNPIGVVHGGLAATLLDSAMGCAVQSLSPTGVAYTTLELKVNLIRALRQGMGIVRAEGWVLHYGRQTALAEARLLDERGKLCAHATSTCLIVRPDSR